MLDSSLQWQKAELGYVIRHEGSRRRRLLVSCWVRSGFIKKIKQDKSTFHRGGQKEKVSSRLPSETNQTPWSVIFQDATLESLMFAAGTEQTEMPGQQMCWCQADFPDAIISPVLYDGSIISSLLASTASLLRRSVARTLCQFTFILGVLRISIVFCINSILSNVSTELYYVITFSSSCHTSISNADEVQILNFVFLRWYLWSVSKKSPTTSGFSEFSTL